MKPLTQMESTGWGEGAQGLDRPTAILWLGETLAGVPRHPGARPVGDWYGGRAVPSAEEPTRVGGLRSQWRRVRGISAGLLGACPTKWRGSSREHGVHRKGSTKVPVNGAGPLHEGPWGLCFPVVAIF